MKDAAHGQPLLPAIPELTRYCCRKALWAWPLILSLFCLLGCSEKRGKGDDDKKTLKDAFSGYFYVGAAVNSGVISKADSLPYSVLTAEFNSITPENIMKWMYIHPAKDTFDFDMADRYVALGEDNGLHIVGHTLVWHSQLANWVHDIKDSTAMVALLTDHINTIVGRYKGKIAAWDVVNEALNEDGTLRESIFKEVLGDGYIDLAFTLASKADPEAQLLYNDYNMAHPQKRAGAIQLIKGLKEKGIKIDGVGMQGHWNLEGPSLEEIETSILAYHEAGVKVSITELDITVLPNPWDLVGAQVEQNFEGSAFMNPYPQGLPDSIAVKLAQRYKDIFALFLKQQDKLDRVTLWGIGDGDSWLNGWPIKGRTNYPLLFDRDYRPKLAHEQLVQLKIQNN